MNWIQRFETKMQEDSKILRNRSLVFNYMILKLLLAGMPESNAKNFVINYYIIQDVEVTPLEMIIRLMDLLKRKSIGFYMIQNVIEVSFETLSLRC